MRACGSANARLPSAAWRSRSRRSRSRLATAWTGQPARVSATASATPTAPPPTIPMRGGWPAPECWWGWAWPSGWTSSPWRCWPGGTGASSIPAAAIAAAVPEGSSSVGSGERPDQAFTGGRPRGSSGRGRLARIECSEPLEMDALTPDPFGARASLGAGLPDLYRLDVLADRLGSTRLPVTVRILLENVLRHAGNGIVRSEDVETLAAWRPGQAAEADIPFMPSRVLLQDFTGVPAIVDLAVMRDAMADLGGDPAKVNPLVPADLVIDHSVQVDRFGTAGAFAFNVEREYERNGERYQLLRWAQTAFRDLRVVPPGTGIIHQVNLEYLATVVADRPDDGGRVAFPDTLVGTDSHTTMINGLGVLGYGVRGIQAEAALVRQPLHQPNPRLVGVRLHGQL